MHRMSRLARPLALAAALAIPLAADPARSAEPKLETEEQKTFYAMGYSLARGVEPFALAPAELELLIAGLRDGVSGAEAKAPPEAYAQKIGELARTRGEAAAAKETGGHGGRRARTPGGADSRTG
jgi:hypothetical protein